MSRTFCVALRSILVGLHVQTLSRPQLCQRQPQLPLIAITPLLNSPNNYKIILKRWCQPQMFQSKHTILVLHPLKISPPPEIKVMILCHMPSLSSLSSIVHASPTYNQAYLGAREKILHNITVRTLQRNDIGLLDPWTAIHAPQFDHYSPHHVETIRKCLERYAEGRMDNTRRRLAPQDSVAILSLHRKFTVLMAKYCKALLSKNPFTEAADNDPLPPSRSELHRLYRALWRYEIYSKLFGPSKEPSGRDLSMTSIDSAIGIEPSDTPGYTSRAEIAHDFFGLFPIHEVEELACLQRFTRDYYHCFQSLSSWESDQLVDLGPKQLYQVMTAASENERETRIAEARKAERIVVTMLDVLDVCEADVRRGCGNGKACTTIPSASGFPRLAGCGRAVTVYTILIID